MTAIGSDGGQGLYRNLISEGECEEIVQNSWGREDFTIVEYKFTKIPEHFGFHAEHLHLEVIVERDGERSTHRYFVKTLPPLDNLEHREMIERLGILRKEVRLYRDIFWKLGRDSEWRPRRYYTRDDLLVLQDMKWSRGFSMVDSRKKLDYNYKDSLQRALTLALAQMHADSLNYEFNIVGGRRLDEMYPDVLFESTVTRNNSWFMAGLSGIMAIALHGTKYGKDAVKRRIMEENLEAQLHRVFDIVKPTTRFQNVLTRPDNRMNTVMFRKSDSYGQVCVLLNFQNCRYLPPVVDVLLNWYLTTSLPTDIPNSPYRNNRSLHSYLRDYYDKLKCRMRGYKLVHAESVLSWEEFHDSVREYKLLALVSAGVYLALTNLPPNVLDDLQREDPARYHAYCYVNRDEFLLRYLREDEFYRETMTRCVEEILEHIYGFDDWVLYPMRTIRN